MRILQLSDPHLSSGNVGELEEYLEALLQDLESHHALKQIDVILFTGDLVDKGGDSLGDDPYVVFNDKFITPLISKLKVPKHRVFFVPGNHDVDRNEIYEDSEFALSERITCEFANSRAEKFHHKFNDDNKRIERFKSFERAFHQDTPNYLYSNNESAAILEVEGKRYGFALINDSWRCSSDLIRERHYFGYKQLSRARRFLVENEAVLNIAVFHHPLEAINDSESKEVKNILKSKNYDVAVFGHSHHHEAESLLSAHGGFLAVNGRSVFGNPYETSSAFQPGYNIIDIDAGTRSYEITARKFIRIPGYRFDKDTDALPDGSMKGQLPQKEKIMELAENSNNDDDELPNSFNAAVERIVELLIGESLYPDKYSFVRELIQNSVDACDRVKDEDSKSNPKITVNINTDANYFEVVDEGDGMSKSVIKNHLSIIGKSISQEYNDNTGKRNLISKFGIGFISTFIVADKVVINTKSQGGEQIKFEIQNVFKGFRYLQPDEKEMIAKTGTTVTVYLKKSFSANETYHHVNQYCRHISNLEVNFNSSRVRIDENWNMEDCLYTYFDSSPRYEAKLGISATPAYIVASNSGFHISKSVSAIIPFRFPIHIKGEVNFFPKTIEFDVSRTNIMHSQSSLAVRRDLSVALRALFNKALDAKDVQLRSIIVDYFHYYLMYFDANSQQYDASYKAFYSKRELISLCAEHTQFDYAGFKQPLNVILGILKSKGIDTIFVHDGQPLSDYDMIVFQYLVSKGHFIFTNVGKNVSFQDHQAQQVHLTTVMNIIAADYGFSVTSVKGVPPAMLQDMKLDKSKFPKRFQDHILDIEISHSVSIEIGKFNQLPKVSVRDKSQIFLNNDHPSFQSLLIKTDELNEESYRSYLLGILSLQL